MSDRFIKFIPSAEADYLQENHPNAFLLLCLIAKRARRIKGEPDGLEIGEAFIGDYKKAGIASEKMYRTAKKILSERGHLVLIETCRNRKKGATGKTTIGTKIKLLRSDIWDINIDHEDDRTGDRGATEGRPKGDEQERIKKDKKEKRKDPLTPKGGEVEFILFRPLVKLSKQQHESLVAEYGLPFTEKMLDILDAYKGSSGKKYKSDYHTMKKGGWVYTRASEESKNKIYPLPNQIDRRTKNVDGSPVDSPADGRF